MKAQLHYNKLCYATPRYAMLCNTILRHTMQDYATQCHAMPHHAMLWYIPCNAMTCHVTLCYAILNATENIKQEHDIPLRHTYNLTLLTTTKQGPVLLYW